MGAEEQQEPEEVDEHKQAKPSRHNWVDAHRISHGDCDSLRRTEKALRQHGRDRYKILPLAEELMTFDSCWDLKRQFS